MKKVIIVYGGDSNEKEISYESAKSIFSNIDKSKYDPLLIDYKEVNFDKSWGNSIFFIAIHGEGGEDGEIQEILENKKIKYTGSNSKAMKLCWDKAVSKKLMIEAGINTPNYVCFKKGSIDFSGTFLVEGNDYFVKPAMNGSSYGISKINKLSELTEALNRAFQFSEVAIVEESYNVAEYTVAILGSTALPPLQIITEGNEFYNYAAKYQSNETIKIKVEEFSLAEKLKKIALAAFLAHGCKTWGRVDIVSNGNDLAVLEINTVPGFTEKSLFPLSAKYSGIEYQELVTEIIEH